MLGAATSEEDFATVLKEADGAFVANQNFHDVEAGMTRTPDLPFPRGRRPAQSRLFPSIHGPIPCPALFRRPGLHFDEDEHRALEDDEVEFVPPVTPIAGEAPAAEPAVMRLHLPLPERAEIRRHGESAPPGQESLPSFGEKHGLCHPKGGFYATG